MIAPRRILSFEEGKAAPEQAEGLPAMILENLLAACSAAMALREQLQDVHRRYLAFSPAVPRATGEELLVDAAEVARMIGRSKSWVDHHIDDLPPRRSLLGQPVWLRRDVERWIEDLPAYGQEPTNVCC